MDQTPTRARDMLESDAQPQSRIEFRVQERRWEALFYAGFGVLIVCWAASKGGWTGIVGGIGFGVFFALLTIGEAMAEPDRSVCLAFDAEGLTMPQAFRQRIPWSAITRYAFADHDSPSLVVHIDNPRLYEPRTENPLATWVATWFGARLPLHDIDGDEDAIEAAFRRFAPHIRRG